MVIPGKFPPLAALKHLVGGIRGQNDKFCCWSSMRIDCCEGPGTGRAESCSDDGNNSSAVGAGLMYGFDVPTECVSRPTTEELVSFFFADGVELCRFLGGGGGNPASNVIAGASIELQSGNVVAFRLDHSSCSSNLSRFGEMTRDRFLVPLHTAPPPLSSVATPIDPAQGDVILLSVGRASSGICLGKLRGC